MERAPQGVAEGHRAGQVALVGRPSVGKSTLLNALVGFKIAPTGPKAQTTRRAVDGVLTRTGAQIVMVDTPGVAPGKGLQGRLSRTGPRLAGQCPVTLCMVTIDHGEPRLHPVEHRLIEAVPASSEVIILINKVDMVRPVERLLPWMAFYQALPKVRTVVPISARRDGDFSALVEAIEGALPQGPPLYTDDQVTHATEREISEELIREAVLLHTQQEVPHRCGVRIDSFEDGRPGGLVHIHGTVLVEREGHKGILIGRGGVRLKAIGTAARRTLESLLDAQVFLRLSAKVQPGWTTDRRTLTELGL